MKSEITLKEAINKTLPFCPIAYYFNNECIWDDDAEETLWEPLNVAMEKVRGIDSYLKVSSINLMVVEFHHTVVHIGGYVDQEVYDKLTKNKKYDIIYM